MALCRDCKHGDRRWRRGRGDEIKKKVVCKVSGSHLPWEHEVGGCRYYDPHDPIQIAPAAKIDPQGTLFK